MHGVIAGVAQESVLHVTLSSHLTSIPPQAIPANALPHTTLLLFTLFFSKVVPVVCFQCHNSHVVLLDSLLSSRSNTAQSTHLTHNRSCTTVSFWTTSRNISSTRIRKFSSHGLLSLLKTGFCVTI